MLWIISFNYEKKCSLKTWNLRKWNGGVVSTSFESDMCQRGTVYVLAHFEKDFSHPQTKLQEGIVFTGVCLFTGRKEG